VAWSWARIPILTYKQSYQDWNLDPPCVAFARGVRHNSNSRLPARHPGEFLMSPLVLPLATLSLGLGIAAAGEPQAGAPSIEQVAEKVRPSVVVITVRGRDGRRESLGTGFVVAADGLIATNRHVIGEGRPITIETADAKRYEVTAVHASDRQSDLAVLRIDARGLPALELGNAASLKDGQAVVAVGNPQGLRHSVVAGVVSGRREIDGRPLIQVAIPIEPGNSGGPLVDMRGRVRGILTIKSLLTPNLGFAVAIDALKPLLRKPNPVPMSAWLTIGALDADEWQPLMGAQWRQRAGRILVSGLSQGFGGRSLCLSRRTVPAAPYEVSVAVRLEDESGAAGLAFESDDGDRHYGFYPSDGQLRLTRFDGPDVFSWHILEQKASPHYRPGEWNTLKVRVEKGRIRCFVNDEPVIESVAPELRRGRAGLAKFRDTVAQFKNFRLGKTVPATAPSVAAAAPLIKVIDAIQRKSAARPEEVAKLAGAGPAGVALLQEQARQLEKQAARLRQLAVTVHEQNVLRELARVTHAPDGDIDLVHAALLVARLDNEDVDVEAYRREVARMADKVRGRLAKDATEAQKLEALKDFLFRQRGFHGSRGDYYNRSNSYLSEVIDDREGLPITLSILYMELARRLGVKVEGVGLPGHFIVRHVPAHGKPRLIDVYEGGRVMTPDEAADKSEAITGRRPDTEQMRAVPTGAVIERVLRNLVGAARRERDAAGMLRYLDAILAVNPGAAEERGLRAGLLYQQGERDAALRDVDWLLEHRPEGIDLDAVHQLRRLLTAPQK
jgi:S1-C subfamily serine protease/regulator of sirC expression with transglutaminase-like and TPR domain